MKSLGEDRFPDFAAFVDAVLIAAGAQPCNGAAPPPPQYELVSEGQMVDAGVQRRVRFP